MSETTSQKQPQSLPGQRFVRWLLRSVAILSGAAVLVVPYISAIIEARNTEAILIAKANDSIDRIGQAIEKKRFDDREAGENQRSALLLFTVALAGLAASDVRVQR